MSFFEDIITFPKEFGRRFRRNSCKFCKRNEPSSFLAECISLKVLVKYTGTIRQRLGNSKPLYHSIFTQHIETTFCYFPDDLSNLLANFVLRSSGECVVREISDIVVAYVLGLLHFFLYPHPLLHCLVRFHLAAVIVVENVLKQFIDLRWDDHFIFYTLF